MISDSGYDPSLAGGRGGYALGSFQGGPDPNAGRDAIVQAVLAQQGVQSQGMNDARGPDQGAPYRQAIGNQGWSVEGNNVFDPSGAIVGRHGLQQYGAIPGFTPQSRGGGFAESQFNRPVGSSLSGGMVTTSPVGPGDFNSDVDISSQGGKGEFAMGGKTMADLPSSGSLFAPGEFGFHAGGGFTGPFSPSFDTPASPPTGEPADPDPMGEREASLSTPGYSSLSEMGGGSMGGFGGSGGEFGGFGGFGGFDAGGMGLGTAGGVG